MTATNLTNFFATIRRKISSGKPVRFPAEKSFFAPAKSSPTDYRHYRLSRREWLQYGGLGTAFCALSSYTFYRSFLVFLLMLPLGLIGYPLVQRKSLCRRRKYLLTLQFRDGISVLSSFLSAGYSVENAFLASVSELRNLYGEKAMITGEFDRIVTLLRLNKPVESVLSDFAMRSGIEDVQNFSEIFRIAKRNGGELCGIIAHTAEVIREKTSVLEEISNLTASRCFEQRIMNFMPFGIILYIDLSSPGFFDVMYQSLLGRTVMTICLIGYAASVYLSARILDIRV